MSDEVESNEFFHILQGKYRRKYEQAQEKSWIICIPCSAALHGLEITDNFVDTHILKPSPHCPQHFVTTDLASSFCFKLERDHLSLAESAQPIPGEHVVRITSEEIGYNKDFHQYKILVIDKPLNPSLKPKPPDEDAIELDRNITSLEEAHNFLCEFDEHDNFQCRLRKEFQSFSSKHRMLPGNLPDIQESVYDAVRRNWMTLLKTRPLTYQRDSRFQILLTTAVENLVMECIHDDIFPIICMKHSEEDSEIYTQTQELYSMGVTADQLGAPEDFAVPLPAAVVELASLDSLTCPIEKLNCLRTTLDLILAELKGAIVDAHSVVIDDCQLPQLTSDDLIPLLETVIIQAKPLHMASNLYYVENFQWTLSPGDDVSFSLVTFKAAVQGLVAIKPLELRPRSEKVHRELALEDLIKVTEEVDQRFGRDGSRIDETPVSPLDRQLERVTFMIEASTRELSDQIYSSGEIQECSLSTQKPTLGEFLSNIQSNIGTCFGKQDVIEPQE